MVPEIIPRAIQLEVCGFDPECGPGASSIAGGIAWKLDDLHGQFSPTWQDDMLITNVNESASGRTRSWLQDSGGPWNVYLAPHAYELRLSHVEQYQQLSRLVPEDAGDAFMDGGCLQTQGTLRPHSVVLLEHPTRVSGPFKADDDAMHLRPSAAEPSDCVDGAWTVATAAWRCTSKSTDTGQRIDFWQASAHLPKIYAGQSAL
eukprot:SAG11_NODE_478_length_9117_cov_6.916168_7_plen_203_part_00